MSAKLRRILRKTWISSIKSSPLITPSSASTRSTDSVAFEFECEPINNSSLSSVFTDSEGIETMKKKTRKKRNANDLKNLVIEVGSTDSVSESETAFKKDVPKRSKKPQISVTTLRSTKKKKRIFTLPDITNAETVPKKARQNKKIRYTEDLDTLLNNKRDSDVVVKNKSKRIKKARIPSYLPSIYTTNEDNKLNKLKSGEISATDSDNKENDTQTESTDTEEYVKKKGGGGAGKTKKRLARNKTEKIDTTDEDNKLNKLKSGEISATDSDNKENDTQTESTDTEEYVKKKGGGGAGKTKKRLARNKTEKVSHENNEGTTKDTNLSTNSYDIPYNKKNNERSDTFTPRKTVLEETRHSKNKNVSSVFVKSVEESNANDQNNYPQLISDDVSKTSNRLSRKGSITTSFDLTNTDERVDIKNDKIESKISKQHKSDQKKHAIGKRKSKRNTFIISDSSNKTGNTSDSKSKDIYSEDYTERSSNLATSKRKSKRTTFNVSDFSNFKSGNTSDFKSKDTYSEDHTETGNKLSTSKSKSRKNTFKEESDAPGDELGNISQDPAETNRDSIRKSSKRATFDIASNLEETSDKQESFQAVDTRNCSVGLAPNLESLKSISEPNSRVQSLRTSPRASSIVAEPSKFESVPDLESSNNVSSPNKSVNARKSTRVIDRSTFNINNSNGRATFNNLEETLDKLETFHTVNTRNCSVGLTSNLENLKSISEPNASVRSLRTSTRASSIVAERSKFESVPDLDPSNNVSSPNKSVNARKPTRVIDRSTFNINESNGRATFNNLEQTLDKQETFQAVDTRNCSVGLAPNLESLKSIYEPNASVQSLRTSTRASSIAAERSKCESVPDLESSNNVSSPNKSVNARKSTRVIDRSTFNTNDSNRRATFYNLEETLDKLETFHAVNTRNCSVGLAPNLESLKSISEPNASVRSLKTSTRASSIAAERSKFESVPNLESSNNVSSPNKSVTTRKSTRVVKRSTFDVNESNGKSPKLRREDTFDVVPPSKYKGTRSSRNSSSDAKSAIVIDLTESLTESCDSSPTKKLKRSTIDTSHVDKRKSSFEVSFRVKKNKNCSEDILDHLNITKRDSGKKSFKKSSTGLKYSVSSEDEDAKPRRNFVTLKRGCQTMMDFDTGESSDELNDGRKGTSFLKKFKNFENLNRIETGDKSVLIDERSSPDTASGFSSTDTEPVNKPATAKKGILKKSFVATTRSTRRDTFEIVESYYESLESIKKSSFQVKPKVSLITEATPNAKFEPREKRDIFDFVTGTPTTELGKMMLGSGESLIENPLLNDSANQSVMPRLIRMTTFTKDEEPPKRKSTRKRWSQVERTPIFDKVPPNDPSIRTDQTTDMTLGTSASKSKSVTIRTPPYLTPKKRWDPSLRTTTRETRATDKGKKSVKIESPLKTPKIRLHSPLVMRKTPKPGFSATEDSILAGNCAYKPSSSQTPPSSTSTPYPKKKEVSLLQKVLTSEKNKSDKIFSKSSVRSKMPNFAKIHQRQYEKMENLKEMQERKAVRAQYLLSGTKPLESVPRSAGKESRKQLFSPVKATEPLKIVTASKKTNKAVSKPLQHMLNKRASLEKKKKGKRVSLEKKKKEIKSKIPVATFKPAVAPVVESKVSKKPEQNGVTRFGFKLPVGKEKLTKKEQIKAVTTKSKMVVNRTETNRSQLGGVRSNRRFELLMKMRQNNNKPSANAVPSRGVRKQPVKKASSVRASPLKKVPKPGGSKHISKPVQHMLNKRAISEKGKKEFKSKIPVRVVKLKEVFPQGVLEENMKPERRGGFTRFGFKLLVGKENVTKSEQIKAVSMKTKVIRNRAEETRKELGRVRSNRRFELLMKMRENIQ